MIELENIYELRNLIINQVEENIHLDYKSADSLQKSDGKKKEIAKDVSAFANSDGGVIIYGIKEFDELEKRHLPEAITPINREIITKEWLEQVINSNITPRMDGIIIQPISVDSNSNDVVYVVYIKKSNTAHQASDFRYYKRFNFESVAMYDYEIKDIMNRKKTPIISLTFILEKYTYEVKPLIPTMNYPFTQKVEKEKEYETLNSLYVYGKNIGGIYTKYVNCFIDVPEEIIDIEEYSHRETIEIEGATYRRIYCENTIREVKEVVSIGLSYSPKYWPSRYDPILPNTRLKLTDIKLRKNLEKISGKIFWEVYADNAEKRTGEIEISEIEIKTKTSS
jgi:hypothetical protein